MSRKRIRCEQWDAAQGWCPASFRGDEADVLWAAEQHLSHAHHRAPGPRLRAELRSRLAG